MVRVFVCDDSPALRLLLRETLIEDGTIEVVGEAATVTEAEERLPAAGADVVLLDLLDHASEDELVGRLASCAPDARFVVYTGMPARAGRAAAAYVPKSAELAELRRVIVEVAAAP